MIENMDVTLLTLGVWEKAVWDNMEKFIDKFFPAYRDFEDITGVFFGSTNFKVNFWVSSGQHIVTVFPIEGFQSFLDELDGKI